MSLFFIIFLLVNVKINAEDIDIDAYCKLPCRGGEVNTTCKFRCEVGPACQDFVNHQLTDDERQYLLDGHNYYRNLVASGHDTRGGNGAATNMMILNYNMEHEIPALCWGKRCIFDHDKCRATKKYPENNGQNLYLSANSIVQIATGLYYLNRSLVGWYEEIALTSRDRLVKFDSRFSDASIMIGHYTQMVWAETEEFGCQRVTYTDRNAPKMKYKIYVLCIYGPAGNYLTLPVYDFGPTASKCPRDKKPNKEYPGLCGEVKHLSNKRQKFPKPPGVKGPAPEGGGSVPINANSLLSNYLLLIFYLVIVNGLIE